MNGGLTETRDWLCLASFFKFRPLGFDEEGEEDEEEEVHRASHDWCMHLPLAHMCQISSIIQRFASL